MTPASSGGSGTDGGDATGRNWFRQALITGAALLIPLAVTLLVLGFVFDLIAQVIGPIVALIQLVFDTQLPAIAVQGITILALLGVITVMGFVAEHRSTDSKALSDVFDHFMSSIPGIGGIYTGVRRMSEVMLRSDTHSFQEVKLIEFPREGMYMLGFVTASETRAIGEATDEEDVITLFVPLAPNPVMGGFLVYLPEDRVYDVGISVEQGVQAVMTSGVATADIGADEDIEPEDIRDKVGERRYGEMFGGESAATPIWKTEEADEDGKETARDDER